LSFVIAEKSLVSEVAEICGTGAELEPEPPDPEDALLPQAATTSAALAAMAAAAAVFVTECKKTTSLMGGTISDHRPLPSPAYRSPLGRTLLGKP
jgi:hypothetical protein